jgi:Mg-chelatase subunit ChlD
MGSFRDIALKGVLLLLFLVVLLEVDPGTIGRFAPERGVCTLFVLDRSESISPRIREKAGRLVVKYMEGMTPHDRTGIVVFGKEPVVEWVTASDGVRWPGPGIHSVPDGSETHIAKALRLAATLFPEGYEKHLVLLSDGHETGGPGDPEDTAARLGLDGIILHVVPLGGARSPGLFLKNVHLPASVHPGVPFTIRTVIEGGGDGELRVFRNGTLKIRETVRKSDLAAGTFPIRFQEEGSGYRRYDIELAGGPASAPMIQRREGIVRSEGPAKVLYLAGPGTDGRGPPPLVKILRGQGVPVEWVSPAAFADRLPRDPLEWSAYGLVVIDNLPASEISSDFRSFLPRYVHEMGGGFLMVGGEEGFGPGGYGDTPVETMMPVSMKVPTGSRVSGMELILLLDKSGSMDEQSGTRQKWKSAVEAAVATLKDLRRGDAVGILAFDTKVREILPLQKNASSEEVHRRLKEIVPGGGTDIPFALEKALTEFRNSRTKTAGRSVRHLILLSDGKTQQETDVTGVIGRLKQAGVTVSAVSIGEDRDTKMLQRLAAGTGGRFYREGESGPGPGDLEKIFRRETLLASDRWFVTEPSRPALKEPLEGLEAVLAPYRDSLPPFQGYVRTSPKASAPILLESDRGDPLIAAWHYGNGRVVAFTSDGNGRWSGEWVNWPPFQAWVGSLVRWAMMPQAADPRSRTQTAMERDALFHKAAEDTGLVPDYPLLKKMADMTGGRFLSPEDYPFAKERNEKAASGELRPIYLMVILLVYILDVAVYRKIRVPLNRSGFTLRRIWKRSK